MKSNDNKNSGKLWGGRFTTPPDKKFFEFNRSFSVDYRLLAADLRASAAHASLLAGVGILSSAEEQKLHQALEQLAGESTRDFQWQNAASHAATEDIHSFIESRLTEKLGELGKKIHSGRSRNDQVATALRLWLRDESDETAKDLKDLMLRLISLAESAPGVAMPAYTHLQRAQPILVAHWCLAYFEMFDRDHQRLMEVRKRVNSMPLGSGALSGTGLSLDRKRAMDILGFESLSNNSLDAVSDRDFVIEWMSFAALTMMHLSRLCEDLILFATHEFSFVELDDAVTSGSSLMPQKKNPDSLELIRGKFGRVLGSLTGMLALMKGLPMAYNKDLQEDKEALFDCVDTTRACLQNMSLILSQTKFHSERLQAEAGRGYMNATDLADLCVTAGMPFREAHEKIGALVRRAIELKVELSELPEVEFQKALPLLKGPVASMLSISECLGRKTVVGSTAPGRVAEALLAAKKRI